MDDFVKTLARTAINWYRVKGFPKKRQKIALLRLAALAKTPALLLLPVISCDALIDNVTPVPHWSVLGVQYLP